jgi:hypothetical protein
MTMNYFNDKRNRFISSSVLISIIALLVAFFIIVVSWNLINWSNKRTDISKQRTDVSLNLLKKFENDTSRVFQLTSNDVKDINLHIDALSEKSNIETEHTIDWINTFMTIGIGLLAIFGGLLPLVVNFFSKEHLQEKISNIEAKLKKYLSWAQIAKDKSERAEVKADLAATNMQGFEGRISTLQGTIGILENKILPFETRVKSVEGAVEKVPFISSLILHNNISRLLSADNIRYYTESNRNERLVKILGGIKSALLECSKEDFKNYPQENLEFLIAVITDFRIGFLYSPINHSLSKKIIKKIDQYCMLLEKFKRPNETNFGDYFLEASTQLQELIDLIQHQDIKSTA